MFYEILFRRSPSAQWKSTGLRTPSHVKAVKSVGWYRRGTKARGEYSIRHQRRGGRPETSQISWITLTHAAVCEPHMLLFHTNLDTILGEQMHIRREENRT